MTDPTLAALRRLVEAALEWKTVAETGGGDAESLSSWEVYKAVDAYRAADPDPLAELERKAAAWDALVDGPRHLSINEAIDVALGEQPDRRRCGCTVDAELGFSSVCPACGHRDHGRSGCEQPDD